MIDLIIVLIVIAVVGMAIRYIRNVKKSGVKCIGCPAAGKCKQNSALVQCSCSLADKK